MTTEYHKIQTVWLRDPATKHKTLLENAWARMRNDDVDMLQVLMRWLCATLVQMEDREDAVVLPLGDYWVTTGGDE